MGNRTAVSRRYDRREREYRGSQSVIHTDIWSRCSSPNGRSRRTSCRWNRSGRKRITTEPETGSERQLRRSNLSVEVVDQNSSHAALRVELRDNQTGDPIFLDTDGRLAPLGVDIRNGYITVDDQRLVTNESGVALLTVNSPGLYTATYHPGSWLSHNPAYVTETVTARWHPLGTLDGWFALILTQAGSSSRSFVMFYAGRRLFGCLVRRTF